MGSSAKKKAEKKKDFKKQSFKVGKQKPKASNLTDTSFRSKGITLRAQSLALVAPNAADQFTHHLSLLTSRSESQRRDSLSFLATFLSSRTATESLPLTSGNLVAKLLPLSVDGSDGVRTQLLRTFKALRRHEVYDQAHKLLLHARVGMTHLSAGIRDTSMDMLAWALRLFPEELVTDSGGWTKTLRLFAVMLSWRMEGSANGPTLRHVEGNSRPALKILKTLELYLKAGLEPLPIEEADENRARPFPIADPYGQHRLPKRPNAFAYLGLFASHQSADDKVYMTREERQEVFGKELRDSFTTNLANAKREAGEIGRAAALVEKAIADGMADS